MFGSRLHAAPSHAAEKTPTSDIQNFNARRYNATKKEEPAEDEEKDEDDDEEEEEKKPAPKKAAPKKKPAPKKKKVGVGLVTALPSAGTHQDGLCMHG